MGSIVYVDFPPDLLPFSRHVNIFTSCELVFTVNTIVVVSAICYSCRH